MFSKSLSFWGSKSTAAGRRVMPHARSDLRKGKQRFSLTEALRRDRIRVEQNKALSFKDRIRSVKISHCLFFVAFMAFWSWLGTHAVPRLKGLTPGNDSQFSSEVRN
ncbi:unnamed protein product [Phytomonas sp. EM1]|nr:unnamed protein product [Phytomonas sp. EM1]|eukprot:CCW64768.1 unnamed protein product [Phytomonas sp. isolate EM1]